MELTIFKPRLKFKPPLKFFKFGHWTPIAKTSTPTELLNVLGPVNNRPLCEVFVEKLRIFNSKDDKIVKHNFSGKLNFYLTMRSLDQFCLHKLVLVIDGKVKS